MSTFVRSSAIVPISFTPLPLSRFAKHKIQPKRWNPRDFRGRTARERGGGRRGWREKDGDRLRLETADLKIAISALFIASLSPFLRAERFWQWRSPIDWFGRSVRSIVLKSALWYVASYYLVIMLRVDFLFSRHGVEETAARVAFDAANTPEMIRFPCSDYQHAHQLYLATFPRVMSRECTQTTKRINILFRPYILLKKNFIIKKVYIYLNLKIIMSVVFFSVVQRRKNNTHVTANFFTDSKFVFYTFERFQDLICTIQKQVITRFFIILIFWN